MTAVYDWDAANQRWFAFFPAGVGLPGANDLDTFVFGEAYWIAINDLAGGTWEVSANAGLDE